MAHHISPGACAEAKSRVAERLGQEALQRCGLRQVLAAVAGGLHGEHLVQDTRGVRAPGHGAGFGGREGGVVRPPSPTVTHPVIDVAHAPHHQGARHRQLGYGVHDVLVCIQHSAVGRDQAGRREASGGREQYAVPVPKPS